MGILKMATADWQDESALSYIYPGLLQLSDTYARTGTYSYYANNFSNACFAIAFSEVSTIYFRYCWKGIAANTNQVFLHGGSNVMARIRMLRVSSTFEYRNGANTLLASSSIDVEDWHCVEIKTYFDISAGTVQVKYDGSLIIDETGVNTDSYADINCVSMSFYGQAYYDDIIVRDDDWPGRGGIYVLTPNAGSTTEEWTPSSGNPEDCVDEQPPSYDDYISTDTDAAQLFGIESLPITPDTINGVGVFSQTKLNTPGDTYAMSILNAGSTKSSGDVAGLTTGSGTIEGYWALNPDDAAAWEEADITALEVGIETVTL